MRTLTLTLAALAAMLLSAAQSHAATQARVVHTHLGFMYVNSLAADGHGNLYAVDQGNQRIIELSPAGSLVRGIQMPKKCGIGGLAVGPAGGIYAVSYCTGSVDRFSATGHLLGTFGKPAGFDVQYKKNPYTAVGPNGLATDTRGNVYVTYAANNTKSSAIREFTSRGRLLRVIGRNLLDDPFNLTIDRQGNLYVVSSEGLTKLSSTGKLLGQWGAAHDISGIMTGFQAVVDAQGNVYVSDFRGGVVMKFSPAGRFVHNVSRHGYGAGQVVNPTGLAIDASGNVFVADAGINRIQEFSASGQFLAIWYA